MEDFTGQFNKGSKNVWETVCETETIIKLQKSFGPNYESDPSYQAFVKLFETIKDQENNFHSQTKELESIKEDTKKFIGQTKEDTKDFKEKINTELAIWRYFIIGALVVIGISFVSLTIDTFWRRNDEFQKINIDYNNKMDTLENKVSNVEESNSVIKNQQDILNCLKDKGYFTIQCFNQ